MVRGFVRLTDGLRRRAWARWLPPDQARGRIGEDLAHRFLQRAGMTVVARNYRTRAGAGELDLVAWEGETLVFIEVKTRGSDEIAEPASAVDEDKEVRLLRAAREYIHRAGLERPRVRFDIVSVVLAPLPRIDHLRDALAAGGAL